MGRSFIGGVKNEFCVALCRIDGCGMEQAVTVAEELSPAIGIQDITLDQFKAVLASQVLCMLADMSGLFRVVEVANYRLIEML